MRIRVESHERVTSTKGSLSKIFCKLASLQLVAKSCEKISDSIYTLKPFPTDSWRASHRR